MGKFFSNLLGLINDCFLEKLICFNSSEITSALEKKKKRLNFLFKVLFEEGRSNWPFATVVEGIFELKRKEKKDFHNESAFSSPPCLSLIFSWHFQHRLLLHFEKKNFIFLLQYLFVNFFFTSKFSFNFFFSLYIKSILISLGNPELKIFQRILFFFFFHFHFLFEINYLKKY